MAYRRGLSTWVRASLVARRYQPSFSYLLHHTWEPRDAAGQSPCPENFQNPPILQQRSFSAGFGAAFRARSCSGSFFLPNRGSSFYRYMSTIDGEFTDKISDAADVLTDTTLQAVASQAQAPVVNEVAIAAADSFPPSQLLQHLVDSVHQFTGLNWAVSIALTTLLIRTLLLPVEISLLKWKTKCLVIVPRLREITDELLDIDAMSKIWLTDDLASLEEMWRKMTQPFTKIGCCPFYPLKGMVIHGSVFISFFLAIRNMVKNVPSFKTGGVYWFTDLTTPDSFYILPVLMGLTFLFSRKRYFKKHYWHRAVVVVPVFMFFSKAILCYFIASRVTTIVFSHVLDLPDVRKYLGIPQLPVNPQTATGKSSSGVPRKEVKGRKEN